MKQVFNLVLTLSVLLAIGLACDATTANLSDISFAKDEGGKSKIDSAKQGDTVFVLSSVNNAGSKYKAKWEAFRESGESIDIGQNEIEVDGSRAIWFTFTVPPSFPSGKYKFQVTLLNEEGKKEIDKKTGTINIKGNDSAKDDSTDKNTSDETDGTTADETDEDVDEK